ncbi:MAG: FAD-dependent oxidoreductase [Pseudomonadota bacterium]
MALREIDHLLLGGGGASAAAAETLRLEGAIGSIMILSAESQAPYYRPALSKEVLLGTAVAQRALHPPSFYLEQAVELGLDTEVAAVDAARQTVTTRAGEQFRYGHLLIATGSRPIALQVPGAALAGVHYLRNSVDCDALRRAITRRPTGAGKARAARGVVPAQRAVVLGGSFMGMEIAMSLIALGLHVTVVEREAVILPHLEAPLLSDHFRRRAESLGALVLLSDTIVALHGAERVREAETASGRRLPCDLLVVSIGVMPGTDFLAGSGIALEQGLVVVDALMRASAPNVFAAGDVTQFDDPVFARRRHVEHWDNAVQQGRLAARNMLGRRVRNDEVSCFFCDIGDVSFSLMGAPEDADERIVRGSLEQGSCAVLYLRDHVLRALFSMGRPADETRHAEGLIRYRVNLLQVRDRLQDPGFALDQIPTQTVLALQGGGAMGAFECGVVKALEEDGIFPDIVAGISIGALNGAIVAAHPRHATAALESFWADLAVHTPFTPGSEAGRAATALQVLMCGVPKFFRPRWLPTWPAAPGWPLPMPMPMHWTSYYDTAPMKELISQYVDFKALKTSPVRLLVGAVNVTSGEMEVFDSYVDELTPEHILASGSLPPGFPWTEIDGKAYWDGGILSNSPLDLVVDRCGADGKRVFIVDLFSGQRPLPQNMVEVMARRDEIAYSERVRSDLHLRETVGAYRRLLEGVLDLVEPAARARIQQRPLYIELMGNGTPMHIVRFVRAGQANEPASRDYDFSLEAIRLNQAEGHALVKKTLHEAREGRSGKRRHPRAAPGAA